MCHERSDGWNVWRETVTSCPVIGEAPNVDNLRLGSQTGEHVRAVSSTETFSRGKQHKHRSPQLSRYHPSSRSRKLKSPSCSWKRRERRIMEGHASVTQETNLLSVDQEPGTAHRHHSSRAICAPLLCCTRFARASSNAKARPIASLVEFVSLVTRAPASRQAKRTRT